MLEYSENEKTFSAATIICSVPTHMVMNAATNITVAILDNMKWALIMGRM
jgi:hypothetical protein